MNALVLNHQEVAWVTITQEGIAAIQKNKELVSHIQVFEDVPEGNLGSLETGRGIPCGCGCRIVMAPGTKAIAVTSPFSPKGKPSRTFYYYASVECERRAMVAALTHSDLRGKLLVEKTPNQEAV